MGRDPSTTDQRLTDSGEWPSGQRPGLLPALLRRALAAMTRAAARAGRTLLVLEYPTSADPGPRYGHGKPAHARLDRLLGRERDRYRGHLDGIRPLLGTMAKMPRGSAPSQRQPHWDNVWLSGLDAASLWYFLAERRPERYVEVGSGMSTRWAREAIGHHELATSVTSIDPQPREEVEELCDVIVRQPLELADLGSFEELGEGDVVFMDGSHRAFANSDATVFFLDVIPELRPGVLVGIHDVLLPWDYPPEWTGRFYSEQYLLASYLLGGAERMRIELPCFFAANDPELGARWAQDWRAAGLGGVPSKGQAFWFTTTA
jgi:Methyltransferase domain